MNIFIAGATGRVAGHVISILAEQGHTVYCGCRRPETISETERQKPLLFDLHVDLMGTKFFLEGQMDKGSVLSHLYQFFLVLRAGRSTDRRNKNTFHQVGLPAGI